MKPILASEFDDYLNSLKILDVDEDKCDNKEVFEFEGMMLNPWCDAFYIMFKNSKLIDDRYFEIDFNNDHLTIFVSSIFSFNYNNIEIIDKKTGNTIFIKENLNKISLIEEDRVVSCFETKTANSYRIEETIDLINIRHLCLNYDNHEVIVKLW